jgi:hypothetical protein
MKIDEDSVPLLFENADTKYQKPIYLKSKSYTPLYVLFATICLIVAICETFVLFRYHRDHDSSMKKYYSEIITCCILANISTYGFSFTLVGKPFFISKLPIWINVAITSIILKCVAMFVSLLHLDKSWPMWFYSGKYHLHDLMWFQLGLPIQIVFAFYAVLLVIGILYICFTIPLIKDNTWDLKTQSSGEIEMNNI